MKQELPDEKSEDHQGRNKEGQVGDSGGTIPVPTGPDMNVEWNQDAIDRMTTGTQVVDPPNMIHCALV